MFKDIVHVHASAKNVAKLKPRENTGFTNTQWAGESYLKIMDACLVVLEIEFLSYYTQMEKVVSFNRRHGVMNEWVV